VSALRTYLEEVREGGYEDKHEPLFVAAWEHLEAAYLDRIFAAIATDGEWRDRFRAGARETVLLVEAHRPEARFLTAEALLVGPVGRARQRALGDRLIALVDSAREELEEPDLIPRITAGWIVGVFFDRIYRRCINDSEPELTRQLPELMFLGVSAYLGTRAGMEELSSPL